MTYDRIEDKFKIKIFEIERNQEVINKINSQVDKCRNYIKSINESKDEKD